MTALLEKEISVSCAYSSILAVFPYSATAYVYNQLRKMIPVSWTGEVTLISVEKVFDIFTQIVPQKEMDTYLPRLVEQLAVIVRIGPFDEVERIAKRSTLRIVVPLDTDSDSESDTESDDGYVPRICYCT